MDDAAFARIVEQYQQRVFQLAASILGPYRDAEAEEVAQEAFLSAYRNLGSYRGASSFSTWLYRITYNCALDRRRLARFRLPHLPAESLAGLASPGGGPLEAAVAAQRRERVARILEAMPEQARTLLYMYYWMECPLSEMAELTGTPEGTLKSQLARARARFEHLYLAEAAPR